MRQPIMLVLVALSIIATPQSALPRTIVRSAVQAPVLKWAYAGCFSSYCQTGWYSSPAVADAQLLAGMSVRGSTV